MNIHIEVEQTTDFPEKAEAIWAALRMTMREQTLELLGYIKDEKLSGQLIKQRTGNLKNSGFTETEDGSNEVTGFVGFGRTVPYAAILNYGGSIHVPEVSGKLMVFQANGQTVFTSRHKVFTVNMPARNYLETSLDEKTPAIEAAFEASVTEASSA